MMFQGSLQKIAAKLSLLAIAATTAATTVLPAEALPGSVNGRYQIDPNSPLLIEGNNEGEDFFIDPYGDIPPEPIDTTDDSWIDYGEEITPTDNLRLDPQTPLLLENDPGEDWLELEEVPEKPINASS